MKIKIGFFAVMLCLSLLLDHSAFSLASLLAALTHEAGHICMARLCRIRLRECEVGIFGAGLTPDDGIYSYGQELLLCLAGPLTNLFLGSLGLWLMDGRWGEWVRGFVFSSFSLGILNLLPIRGFDGGRILTSLLCLRLSPLTARRILGALSFFCVFLLWTLSVYLLLRAASSLSLFVFSLSLFCRIFLSERE